MTTCLQRDAEGRPLRFLTHVQDMDDRKRVEETPRGAKTIPTDGTGAPRGPGTGWSTSSPRARRPSFARRPRPGPGANWVSKNIERLLGFTVEEALDPAWWDAHVHPDDLPRVLAEKAALFTNGYLVEQYRFSDKRGTTDGSGPSSASCATPRESPSTDVVGHHHRRGGRAHRAHEAVVTDDRVATRRTSSPRPRAHDGVPVAVTTIAEMISDRVRRDRPVMPVPPRRRAPGSVPVAIWNTSTARARNGTAISQARPRHADQERGGDVGEVPAGERPRAPRGTTLVRVPSRETSPTRQQPTATTSATRAAPDMSPPSAPARAAPRWRRACSTAVVPPSGIGR